MCSDVFICFLLFQCSKKTGPKRPPNLSNLFASTAQCSLSSLWVTKQGQLGHLVHGLAEATQLIDGLRGDAAQSGPGNDQMPKDTQDEKVLLG